MSFLDSMQNIQRYLAHHRERHTRQDIVHGIKSRMGCLLTPQFSDEIDRIFGKDRHPVTFELLDDE